MPARRATIAAAAPSRAPVVSALFAADRGAETRARQRTGGRARTRGRSGDDVHLLLRRPGSQGLLGRRRTLLCLWRRRRLRQRDQRSVCIGQRLRQRHDGRHDRFDRRDGIVFDFGQRCVAGRLVRHEWRGG